MITDRNFPVTVPIRVPRALHCPLPQNGGATTVPAPSQKFPATPLVRLLAITVDKNNGFIFASVHSLTGRELSAVRRREIQCVRGGCEQEQAT